MKKNYCVMSMKDLKTAQTLDAMQVTLNTKVHPNSRNTVSHILNLEKSAPKTDKFIHSDYLLTAPRFSLLDPNYQKAYVREILDILGTTAPETSKVRGMVIHMDAPFKKEMLEEMFTKPIMNEQVAAYYAKKYFIANSFTSQESIITMLTTTNNDTTNSRYVTAFMETWYWASVGFLALHLFEAAKNAQTPIPRGKIYLENTTKVPVRGSRACPGMIDFNARVALEFGSLFGICIDTEHAYASKDFNLMEDPVTEDMERLIEEGRLMVHLNTIPANVTPGSYKDDHSFTSISECSKYTYKDYVDLTNRLDSLNIPWIREVKSETMERELNYNKQWDLLS